MQLGIIGPGRMGGNMVQRLVEGGHQLAVYDRSADAVKAQGARGARGSKDLPDLCAQLSPPRIVWVMVPAGSAVETTLEQLLPGLARGDIIIDGGNSNYRDSIRRGDRLRGKELEFIDAGTSGGIWGLTVGYCLMVGASPGAFQHCEPIFRTLAPPDGYAHVGPPGGGSLRQDDSQRDRIRPAPGLCRRLRDSARLQGLHTGLASDGGGVEPRQCGPLLAQ